MRFPSASWCGSEDLEMGLLDLTDQFTFYAQYHNNSVNQVIHIVCVWPILWTALVLLWYTPDFESKGHDDVVPINGALFTVIAYVVFYLALEISNRKCLAGAGVIAALLTVFSYVTAGLFQRLRFVPIPGLGHPIAVWHIALALHGACWIAQFVGHGVFERRSPALLDNVLQAFFMAPIFVVLEVMFRLGYKKEFRRSVQVEVDDAIAEWKAAQDGHGARTYDKHDFEGHTAPRPPSSLVGGA